MSSANLPVLRFRAVELRPAQRQLLVGGRPAPVGGRAFDLLLALVAGRDRVLGKQELLDLVWPGQAVEEGNLQAQVSALRRHIGRDAIVTVPGRGYRFVLQPSVPASPTTAGATGALLLGRSAEYAALASAVDAAADVLLTGEAGMGKSRLLAELVQTHALGTAAFIVVGARPADASLPLSTFARLLRAMAARQPDLPDAVARNELARAVPEWGTPPPASDGDGPARLAAAAAALLAANVEAGTRAVVLDDLHFADDASVGLLQRLHGESRCAWVVAQREAELRGAARAWADGLRRLSSTRTLPLAPLDEPAVEQMLAAFGQPAAGRAQRAAALLRHTGGNPLFLLETLQQVRAAGPQREAGAADALAPLRPATGAEATLRWPAPVQVKQLLRQRLTALGPGATRLLRCAAVAGEDLQPALAAALLGVTPLALADDWAELEAAQVLRGNAFAHDLVAEAAQELLPAPIAAELHGQVADWLTQRGADPARVAAHALRSDAPRRAVPALLAAGRQARAAALWAVADTRFSQAARLLEGDGDAAGAFEAWFCAADARSQLSYDSGYGALCERLDALAGADEGRLAMAGLARLAALAEQRLADQALALARTALARARRAGLVDIEVELLWSQLVLHWDRRELAAARAAGEQALARLAAVDPATSRMDLRHLEPRVMQVLGMMQLASGDHPAAQAPLAQAQALSQSLGASDLVLAVAHTRAASLLELGDAAGGHALLAPLCAQLAPPAVAPSTQAVGLATMSRLLLARGDVAGAWQAGERAVQVCAQSPVRYAVRVRRQHLALAHRLGHAGAADGLAELVAEGRGDATTRALVGATARWMAATADGPAAPPDGEPDADTDTLLAEAGRCQDLRDRALLLCLLSYAASGPELALLLQAQAASAQAQGVWGIWLSLTAARAVALQRLGRTRDAVETAQAAWQRLADGTAPAFEPVAEVGTALHGVLRRHDQRLAATVALRVHAWACTSAAALPRAWREPYLRPLLLGVGLPARAGARPPRALRLASRG